MIAAFEITELNRRLANLILIGKVVEVNAQGAIPLAKVQVGDLKTAWLPMLVQRAGADQSGWLLEADEQVLVLSPSGEIDQGVVLGSLNQNNTPSPAKRSSIHQHNYSDGAVISYDRDAHALNADLPEGATVTLTAKGGLTFTGDLTLTGSMDMTGDLSVTGNISATSDITDKTRSMQADRLIYNTHKHTGVLSGNSTTAEPTAVQ